MNCGTLDPVAAFLLTRGDPRDSRQAEADAEGYYAQLEDDVDPNDMLDPSRIRDWVEEQRPPAPRRAPASLSIARLERSRA